MREGKFTLLKRIISAVLTAVLVFTSADFSVFAAEAETESVSPSETSAAEAEKKAADTKQEFENASVEENTEEKKTAENAAETETRTETEEESSTGEDKAGEEELQAGETSGKCGDNLTWKFANNTLTISGTGAMWNYKYKYDSGDMITTAPWGQYCETGNVELVINNGITSIGDFAFYYCSGFTGSLTIPGSVTSIGYLAFLQCGFRGSLTIPESVTSIGEGAFLDCSGFTGSLTIPESVTSIGNNAFGGCSGFTGSLTIPNSVTSIGAGAFRYCDGFTGNLIIPNSVTSIGGQAFHGCSGFTGSLIIPSGVTSIDSFTFSYCTKLTDVYITSTMKVIDDESFVKGYYDHYVGNLPITFHCPVGSYAYKWASDNGFKVVEWDGVTLPGGDTPPGGDIQSVKWEIDNQGTLTITGTGDWEREVDGFGRGYAPWYKYADQIKKAVVNVSGTTDASYMFFQCRQLENIDLANFDMSNVTNAKNMLYGDNLLLTIKTPLNLGQNVSLPNTFYANGQGLMESLPMNTTSSITLYRVEKAKYVSATGKMRSESDGIVYVGDVDISLNETLLGQSSKIYNHDIAKFAIQMSTMCYSEDKMMQDAIRDLGFYETKIVHEDYSKFRDEYGVDYDGRFSKYWIAAKNILLNGSPTTLICVFIRGTSGMEWIDNFDPGMESTHNGFQRAAGNVYSGLEKYILDNGLKNNNIKLIITGHSRGAATANLLGAKIDDDGLTGIASPDKDVYVYTYATPNTSRNAGSNVPKNPKYNNIYNIVNPEDFVTKVLPSKWGYGRYGITYVLPSKTTEGKRDSSNSYVYYDAYKESVEKAINQRIKQGTTYKPYPGGMDTVSYYISFITGKVTDIKRYYSHNLFFEILEVDKEDGVSDWSLHQLYTRTLAYYMTGGEYKKKAYVEMGLTAASKYGWTGSETLAYFGLNQSNKKPYFEHAHQPETYLAAMETLTEAQLKQPRGTLYGIANCPVDITIYDADNNIAGQITDNVVSNDYTGVQMDVDGDSKTFWLPADSDYRVVLSGNDNGVLDYSLATVDPDTGETERVFYKALPVSDTSGGGAEYTQNVTADKNIDEMALVNADAVTVAPAAVLGSEDLGKLSVNVKVEGNGTASGFLSLSPGDYVTLEAAADENNIFTGWYDSAGNFITKETKYSFSISESMSFTAKFAELTEALPLPVSDIASGSVLNKGDKITLSCSAEGASIYYTTDGTVPTRQSTLYTEPIAVLETVTIKAFAVKEGYRNSEVAEFAYTVKSDDPSTPAHGDILPEDLPADGKIPDGLWIANLSSAGYAYTGDAIIPQVRVYDADTLLAEKTDYTISFKNNVKAGKASVTVTGKGNYSGKETATFDILPADIGGAEVHVMDFCVKTGSREQKPIPEIYYMGTRLKNNSDFTLSYSNASNIYSSEGEHDVTATGTGNYKGTRTFRLKAVSKIEKKKPVSISGARFSSFDKTFTYTGKPCVQDEYCRLIVKGPRYDLYLEEGTDYTVSYANNVKAGTATATYYGRNGFTGKVKKTFKILPRDIDSYEVECERGIGCFFAKGGAKPGPVLKLDGRTLKEGRDYALSWKNNAEVYGNGIPTVIISGKGNFTGKRTVYFTINQQDLSKMTLVSCDKVYNGKAGNYKIVPKLMDLDGKLLSPGKDYDAQSITYAYAEDVREISKKAGDKVEDTDIIPAGTQIRVTLAAGTGRNYTGTFEGTYRIAKADIKSAKITIPNQTYTGKAVTLDKQKITVTLAGSYLNAEDYDIIQYADNVKKGKASATIKGKGNYGGTRIVTFTIEPKRFLWWKKD